METHTLQWMVRGAILVLSCEELIQPDGSRSPGLQEPLVCSSLADAEIPQRHPPRVCPPFVGSFCADRAPEIATFHILWPSRLCAFIVWLRRIIYAAGAASRPPPRRLVEKPCLQISQKIMTASFKSLASGQCRKTELLCLPRGPSEATRRRICTWLALVRGVAPRTPLHGDGPCDRVLEPGRDETWLGRADFM